MSSLKELRKAARDAILQVPDIERKVKAATSNDKWGPTSTQMKEIARATLSYADYPLIMNAIWRRLDEPGKHWRHIYKTLLLLDYLLKNGAEQVAAEARAHILQISTLTSFRHVDPETGKDVGVSIRERSKKLQALLSDEAQLAAERATAAKNANKYGGVSSDDHFNGRGGTSASGRSYGGFGSESAPPPGSWKDDKATTATKASSSTKKKKPKPVESSSDSSSESDSDSDSSDSSDSSSDEAPAPVARPRAASGAGKAGGKKKAGGAKANKAAAASPALFSPFDDPPAAAADPFDPFGSSSAPSSAPSSAAAAASSSLFDVDPFASAPAAPAQQPSFGDPFAAQASPSPATASFGDPFASASAPAQTLSPAAFGVATPATSSAAGTGAPAAGGESDILAKTKNLWNLDDLGFGSSSSSAASAPNKTPMGALAGTGPRRAASNAMGSSNGTSTYPSSFGGGAALAPTPVAQQQQYQQQSFGFGYSAQAQTQAQQQQVQPLGGFASQGAGLGRPAHQQPPQSQGFSPF
mmetsp:Transcript_6290/g.20509  ORF Transcript_6290/g.20509 Transcript_6290/m.20509 type:complete len:527 (-) Transcript_6290:69-1649(-)